MRFTKMHGCGNDYVYLDCFRDAAPSDPAALAIEISDRHFGIGSDGLILIGPSTIADAKMRMFNADGSEAEMCGNGLRCVAKFVHDHDIAKKSALQVETGRGVLAVELEIESGKASRATIDMGEPILHGPAIPTTLQSSNPGNVVAVPLEIDGEAFVVTCVSVGNPHCVIFVPEITDHLVLHVGPKIERHPAFPKRVNVEFIKVHSRTEATMRVWERGSGETWACGTGACAVAVAGVLAGHFDRHVKIHLRGGDLQLHWSESDGHVYMTGPAVEVYSGEWPDR